MSTLTDRTADRDTSDAGHLDTTFASSSVSRHVARGLLGAVVMVAALVLAGSWSSWALIALPVSLWAWRGCPTCWALGMSQSCALARSRR